MAANPNASPDGNRAPRVCRAVSFQGVGRNTLTQGGGMSDPVSLKLALSIAGSMLLLAAGFCSWVYAQFIAKNIGRIERKFDSQIGELRKRLGTIEVRNAEKDGQDLPERINKIEDQVPQIDKDVAVLKSSEGERNTRLAQGLAELERLVEQLREDINKGDLESRISSAQALVRSLQVAATLAKLQSSDAQERAQHELRAAEATLIDLMRQRES
jgi:hypothetical protein